ncbi:MAG: DUF4870 domain-containing protein [Eubacteriales bacterium]|nr:DUF4870 domain-containing protein [Eubacteriales bacterium]
MSDQKNSLGMDEKTASWFAYIISIISAIILLATEKENKTVRIHAWQSLILGCVVIVAYIILFALAFIPYVGLLFMILYYLVWVSFLVLSIICIIKAAQGDIFKIPVIYNKAKDLK